MLRPDFLLRDVIWLEVRMLQGKVVTWGERGDCGDSSVPVIGGDFCVRRGGPPAGACVEDRRRQTDN
jgi:hypothetical protein